MIGSDVLKVNDIFEKTYEINATKNKDDEPVISLREATEAICRLLKTVPPGAGDIVRNFMVDQEDKTFMNYSDFVKLFSFGFYHHIVEKRKLKEEEEELSWTMIEYAEEDERAIIVDEPLKNSHKPGDFVIGMDPEEDYDATMDTKVIQPKWGTNRVSKK